MVPNEMSKKFPSMARKDNLLHKKAPNRFLQQLGAFLRYECLGLNEGLIEHEVGVLEDVKNNMFDT